MLRVDNVKDRRMKAWVLARLTKRFFGHIDENTAWHG